MLPKGTRVGKAFSEKKALFQFTAKAVHEREYESHMRAKRGKGMAFLLFVRHSWYEAVAHAASLNVSSQYKHLSI